MNIYKNVSLKPYHTFAMEVSAECMVELLYEDELVDFLVEKDNYPQPLLFLGSGSNVLFLNDFQGTVVRILTKGIVVVEENSEEVMLNVAAGEDWDHLVSFTVDNGWGGLENLSLIPGLVGTAPVQNIGAYGVEVKDVLDTVEVIGIESLERRVLVNEECDFGYRDSIFKRNLKKSHIILNVSFRLSKRPSIKTEYGNIAMELERQRITSPGIKDVRNIVCAIRSEKLPDPRILGNAGSFFKNPVISLVELELLKKSYPSIAHFYQGDKVKLAAAWLIEQCGWKGHRVGDAGVHVNQPLVLVNYGIANGMQILNLAKEIIGSVATKFGVTLEPEVNIIS